MSHFVPVVTVSPDTTLKEMPSIKLMTALLFLMQLDTRRILKYFLNINCLTFSVCEHREYPGLTVNSNAPFCFDRVECLEFFGPRGLLHHC